MIVDLQLILNNEKKFIKRLIGWNSPNFSLLSQADKNVELRKRKPDYKPYDEPEIDEYGKVSS